MKLKIQVNLTIDEANNGVILSMDGHPHQHPRDLFVFKSIDEACDELKVLFKKRKEIAERRFDT